MITRGKKVIKRTSLRIQIDEKNWDSTTKRVKPREANYLEINQIITSLEIEFGTENLEITSGNDEACAIRYFENALKKSLEDGTLKFSTHLKYCTILKSVKQSVLSQLSSTKLPFKELRQLETIRLLTLGLKKSYRKYGTTKNERVVFNYMSVFRNYVNHWNKYSGTQFPINTGPFFNYITKKVPKKLAVVLTESQIIEMENYQPKGKSTIKSEQLAKNIFLFQYYAGGLRIQDCLLLNNKMFHEDKLVTTIKKTGGIVAMPYYIEMLNCLKNYYPIEYENSINPARLGSIKLPAETISQLYRIDGLDFKEMGLKELESVIYLVSKSEHLQAVTLELLKVKQRFEERIMGVFFKQIHDLPIHFVFPLLKFEDFKDVYDDNRKFSSDHEYIIHRARTRHNSALKRIGKSLGIENLTGHVPRHSLANHLYGNNFSIDKIQQVLVHANPATTRIYLQERHGHNDVIDTLNEFHRIRTKSV